jgi:hypothetical protein
MVGDFFQSSLASVDSQKKPGDTAGRIGEHGQLRAARHSGWRQDRLAAESLDFIQRCLQVVDLDIHRHALGAVLACAHAAIKCLRVRCRYRLRHIATPTHDLEMNDRYSHK